MTMKFFCNYVAAAVLLAYFPTVGQAAEQPRPAKSQAAGTFQVKVSQGDLSLRSQRGTAWANLSGDRQTSEDHFR